MKAHFRTMAAYNGWANRRLYDAAAALPEADYCADLGAAFKSIEGTLNHIMVADLIWLARFRAQPAPPFALDHILHDDRADLAAARRVLDDDIIRYVDETPEAAFAGVLTYRALTVPGEQSQRLDQAVSHLFNHQTHHRGQVHALLTRCFGAGPALDLIYFLRDAS